MLRSWAFRGSLREHSWVSFLDLGFTRFYEGQWDIMEEEAILCFPRHVNSLALALRERALDARDARRFVAHVGEWGAGNAIPQHISPPLSLSSSSHTFRAHLGQPYTWFIVRRLLCVHF